VEAEEGARKDDGTPYTPTDLRVIQTGSSSRNRANVPAWPRSTPSAASPRPQIAPDPKRLAAYNLTLSDLVTALSATTPTSAPATSSAAASSC
jgi:cobalt-zinc-cadmium resistance protein CzcA